MDFIHHIRIFKSEKETEFMRRMIGTPSTKREKTQKYSINQVFTGRKRPPGMALKYNDVMSIHRS